MDVHGDNNDNEDAQIIEAFNDGYWTIVRSTIALIGEYHNKFLSKSPRVESKYTGNRWMTEVLHSHPKRCRRMMRMERNDFIQLCHILESSYDLRSSRNMGVIEKVGLFIFILAHGASNRKVQEQFQHSGETVSRIFHEVLQSVCKLGEDLIKPVDPNFKDTPPEILNDSRYMPYFKDCIGVIDCTHVNVVVPIAEQVRYIRRNGRPTQNILAICNFDMKFLYVLAGYEGTAYDNYILTKAINTPKYKFPKPPPGKYYLVDGDYSQMSGYLGPYKGVKYHFTDFQHGSPPQEYKEVFNKAHSSLRNCIERTFGAWKKRWDILCEMPSYEYKTQVKIVVATMTLHNFIRGTTSTDAIFQEFDMNPNSMMEENLSDDEANQSNQVYYDELDNIRNQIALSLMERKSY